METPSKFAETPFGWGGVGTRRPEADIGVGSELEWGRRVGGREEKNHKKALTK